MSSVKTQPREDASQPNSPRFVDVFAGCGGLSLGLKRAGWTGMFAIEKDPFAFATLSANFLEDGSRWGYDWPEEIERRAWEIEELLDSRKNSLKGLAGHIALLSGGPPCQGFSQAGRRRRADPRNALVDAYAELVKVVRPCLLLLENVRGFAWSFKSELRDVRTNFAAALKQELSRTYDVSTAIVHANDYGVPQGRSRYILVGALKELQANQGVAEFFDRMSSNVAGFLHARGLPRRSTSRDAISDLEVERNGTVESPDTNGFQATGYVGPRTAYQRAMRNGCEGPPSDMRLARHGEGVRARFREIIRAAHEEGRLNMTVSRETRKEHGIKKAAVRVLDPLRAAPTVTSLPEDLIHYSEPRTLTVRENARLQAFPDWFAFRGNYTTGGHRRRKEVPRFSQVANAVPPLLAEQLGVQLMRIYKDAMRRTGS